MRRGIAPKELEGRILAWGGEATGLAGLKLENAWLVTKVDVNKNGGEIVTGFAFKAVVVVVVAVA